MKPAWEAPPARPPLEFTPEILFVFAFCAVVGLFSYLGVHAWHFTNRQMIEIDGYIIILALAVFLACWFPLTGRSRREKQWPHPPVVMKPLVDEKQCRKAWAKNSVVLGYDIHGKPFLWPDRIRVPIRTPW